MEGERGKEVDEEGVADDIFGDEIVFVVVDLVSCGLLVQRDVVVSAGMWLCG